MNKIFIPDETAMLAFGQDLARSCLPGLLIYLKGELGAGKTTLTRGFLRGLGYKGLVKSPTYTLVESYSFKNYTIHHFDLYRLHDPEELEHMGFRDYLTEEAISLIEWPERANRILPEPTISCTIEIAKAGVGRWIQLSSHLSAGKSLIKVLKTHYGSDTV